MASRCPTVLAGKQRPRRARRPWSWACWTLSTRSPGERVLEIGTGTGWNAALLASVVGAENVVTVEIDQRLAERARKSLASAGYGAVQVLTMLRRPGPPPGLPTACRRRCSSRSSTAPQPGPDAPGTASWVERGDCAQQTTLLAGHRRPLGTSSRRWSRHTPTTPSVSSPHPSTTGAHRDRTGCIAGHRLDTRAAPGPLRARDVGHRRAQQGHPHPRPTPDQSRTSAERMRCMATSVDRSRTSPRAPGSTGFIARTVPSEVVTQKQT